MVLKTDRQTVIKTDVSYFTYRLINKQEAHEPHRSPEKTVKINRHIRLNYNVD